MNKGHLKDAKLPVQVVLGNTEMTVEEVSRLRSGSILGLESFAGEPVDLLVAGVKVAKGEVVVIDENFGLRVTELVETEE